MELSTATNLAFRVLATSAIITVDGNGVADDNIDDKTIAQVALSSQFEPSLDVWTHSDDNNHAISEPGEYEIGSVYIIATPSAAIPASDGINRPNEIEMIYAVETDEARLCLIGRMTDIPNRQTTERITSTFSTNIVAADLAKINVGMSAFANFIRGLNTKQLVVKSDAPGERVETLAKEIGVEKIQPQGTFVVKSRNLPEKLTMTILTNR